MLRSDDLHFSYDGNVVLDGVGLGVDRGETVALVGPSGSGKSTLLYCLAGILVPAHGSVVFDGQVLGELDEKERTLLRRRSFGFVLQFGRLMADLTATENVSFPLRLLGVKRAAAEAAAREALDAVGLADRGERRAATLSGGEQQRAAVARALIHEPAVVFADEPTGALDTANGAVVMDALLSTARQRGAAVVLVTHDPAIAAGADRRIHLRDGRIVDGERAGAGVGARGHG
ncbi:ABC transporter ATP-binding protein [Nocardioides sp.]|uniref:ABC transporter ATP-binding protein n=1 Tax=Nocardioides sp. TaxID=35761 RepID=UPI0035166750